MTDDIAARLRATSDRTRLLAEERSVPALDSARHRSRKRRRRRTGAALTGTAAVLVALVVGAVVGVPGSTDDEPSVTADAPPTDSTSPEQASPVEEPPDRQTRNVTVTFADGTSEQIGLTGQLVDLTVVSSSVLVDVSATDSRLRPLRVEFHEAGFSPWPLADRVARSPLVGHEGWQLATLDGSSSSSFLVLERGRWTVVVDLPVLDGNEVDASSTGALVELLDGALQPADAGRYGNVLITPGVAYSSPSVTLADDAGHELSVIRADCDPEQADRSAITGNSRWCVPEYSLLLSLFGPGSLTDVTVSRPTHSPAN